MDLFVNLKVAKVKFSYNNGLIVKYSNNIQAVFN